MVKIGFSFIYVIFLVGCDLQNSSQEKVFGKYHQRLTNILEVSYSSVDASSPVTIPSKRSLFQTLPRLSLGLLESFQLRECGLFDLVAQKNNQLGKVQDAFYDFDYQVKLLKILETCLQNPNLGEQDKASLINLNQQKWQHFNTHLDNLFFTSVAMRKQLTSSQWLVNEGDADTIFIKKGLSTLSNYYQTPTLHADKLPEDSILIFQEKFEKTRLIGKLYYSLKSSKQWLKHTTNVLEKNRSSIICLPKRDKTRFLYLNNVFNSIYINEIQPYLAYLDSTYWELSDGISLVEQRMSLLKETYSLSQTHKQFQQAILDHVQFWQRLFKECGVNINKR
ncbi:DUF3080 domain-containing protein [Vibrio agarivorans]|nr:DUF3080 domain-containing protein [Vibrio agarivorans]